MTIETSITVDQAQSLVDKMIGEYIWGVRLGEDRILQAEFGQPYLRVQPSPLAAIGENPAALETRRLVMPTGRWTLFIEDGWWTASAAGAQSDRGKVDNQTEAKCLTSLSGQTLISVSLSDNDISLTMTFDLGGVLTVRFQSDFADNDQWMMFSQGEGILAFNSSSRYTVEI